MNKTLWKWFSNTFRYIPIIQSIGMLISVILDCFGITCYILVLFSGVSILQLLFYYMTSHLFKFCWKHQLGIHYLSVNFIVNSIDTYIKFPLTDSEYAKLHTLIFLAFIVYYYAKNKLNPEGCEF